MSEIPPALLVALEATARAREVAETIGQLPGPWRTAARLVDDVRKGGGGVTAALRVALAFCDWFLAESARRLRNPEDFETLPSLFDDLTVSEYRKVVLCLLDPPAAPRGRPRRRRLSRSDIVELKRRYKQRLEAHRSQHGPAGDVVRRKIVKQLAAEVRFPAKALYEALFRRLPPKPTLLKLEMLKRMNKQP